MQFDFPSKNSDGDVCAQQFALQVAARAINSWSNENWYNPQRCQYLIPTLRLLNIQKTSEASMRSRSRQSARESGCSTARSGRFSPTSSSSSAPSTRFRFLQPSQCSTAIPGQFSSSSVSTAKSGRTSSSSNSQDSNCSTAVSGRFSSSSSASSNSRLPPEESSESSSCLTALSGLFSTPSASRRPVTRSQTRKNNRKKE